MKRWFVFAILLLSVSLTSAQEICPLNGQPFEPKTVKDLSEFKKVAILDQGRIKPLETFANNLLVQFSGKKKIDKDEAIVWLTKLLLAPQTTKDNKVFLINNPDIATTLGIDVDKHRRYSFGQIEPHFKKLQELSIAAEAIDAKKRDVLEAEIIRLFNNVKVYSLLSLNFAFAFPHPDFTITDPQTLKELNLPSDVPQFSFIDIALRANELQGITKTLESTPTSQWTNTHKELAAVVANLYQWSSLYHSLPFKIVPAYDTSEEWLSPWDALSVGLRTQEGRHELKSLQALMIAYWNGADLEFNLAVKNFNQAVNKRLHKKGHGIERKINIELLYNSLDAFKWAKMIYLIVFFLFLMHLIKPQRELYFFALFLTQSALFFHILGIALRIAILSRPPVSNLYETFIFVAAVSAIVGLIIERINRHWLGIIIASISGFVFLTVAQKFSMEGDTLQMLVAVLNSNFWLSTHVTSITIGYAGTCVAGLIGHIYLIQLITQPKNKTLHASTYRILIGSLGFALAMTFLGTNLGGIWADQSWGRFWGWDPKENGALLIVLWIALLFHAKIAKMIGPLGVAVGSAFGIVVVMWAWFGVNLLSIGLHSYGFTSGLAFNLAIYFILQVLFLLIATPLAIKKSKTN